MDQKRTVGGPVLPQLSHNRDDASLARVIEVLDKVQPRGGDRKSETAKSKTSSDGIDSAQSTAQTLGVSASKIDRARKAKKHDDLWNEVKTGSKTVKDKERYAVNI